MKEISTLKKWGEFYRYMGFAVVPVGKEGDRKRPFVKEWKKWSNQTQTKEEFETLPFPIEATGIGGITGANDIIGIDIDNLQRIEFIHELTELLGLPVDYEWDVLSGSEKGGHIWVECNAHEAFKDLVEKEKNVYTITSYDKSIFDHIEVRVKQHTVLPPSLHPSGKRYEFLNCQQPLNEPAKISPQKLREVLLGLGELKTRKINSNPLPGLPIVTNGNGNGHYSKLTDIVNEKFELVDFAKDFLPDGHIQSRESNGEIRVGKRGEGYGTILISKDGKTWNHPQSDWTGGGWAQMVAYHLTNDVTGYRKEDFGKYLNFAAKWVGLSDDEIKDIRKQEAKAYYNANPHFQKTLVNEALGNIDLGSNEESEENKKEYITKKGKALLWAHKFIMEKWGADLYMSEINKMVIYKEEEIDDMFLNLIWKRCQTSGINVAKDDVRALLINPDIPSRHPIKDFINNQELTTEGNIEKIALSLNTKTYPKDLTILLFKKWYVGMIANIFNEHIKSPLMLVLFGGQNNGKTWFFRNLLPKLLMKFYAENKLDKDVEEIMSGNILVMDDEYGGKSKKDSKLLKDIISKVKFTFRRKFGKLPITLQRIATLCGTTNEPDILVDTTGNRRVIPMEIKERDFDLYDSVDKIQLFLEAYKLYEEGFNYELSSLDIEKMGEYTDKFERETTEGGLIDKYFRRIPDDECHNVKYKDANREGFEWLTTTEIQIHIQQESRISRISSVVIGKELRKSKFFQKSHKVKGKVSRYWACKKIGEGADIETTPF